MKSPRRNKRKNADALSKQLRRRFYKGAAIATTAYVVLSLIKFHGQLSDLPSQLAIIWAVFLVCYTTFKEVLRWNDVGDVDIYHGELWAGVVLAGAAWMITWNIVRSWVFNLEKIPFPSDYESAVIETIVIYVLSIGSSFLHKYRRVEGRSHQKTHARIAQREMKPFVAATGDLVKADAARDSKVKAVLAKTDVMENEIPPEQKS
jgi:hypothetical protein